MHSRTVRVNGGDCRNDDHKPLILSLLIAMCSVRREAEAGRYTWRCETSSASCHSISLSQTVRITG